MGEPLKNTSLGFIFKQSDLIILEGALALIFLKISPSDLNVQLGLRTTAPREGKSLTFPLENQRPSVNEDWLPRLEGQECCTWSRGHL